MQFIAVFLFFTGPLAAYSIRIPPVSGASMRRRWTTIIAILAVEAFVLLIRTVWDLHLRDNGHEAAVAKDLSYLLVPPLLVLLLAPVLRERRLLLVRLLDPRRIAARVVLYGLAVGVLSRPTASRTVGCAAQV